MSYKETLCKGNVYEMTFDENGNEKHVETMNLDGSNATGEPCMSARKGDFPNWTYKVSFGDAYDQLFRWWGSALVNRLKHGENVTLAYQHDKRSKSSKMAVGDVIYEVAFDINYTKGMYYIKDGARRYKIIITKAE